MTQQLNAQGYKLQFPVLGFQSPLADRTLRVRIIRPDGTGFDRLSTNFEEVEVIDEVTKTIGVKIQAGDFNQTGPYQYQAFDETDGIFLPTPIETFYVDANLVINA